MVTVKYKAILDIGDHNIWWRSKSFSLQIYSYFQQQSWLKIEIPFAVKLKFKVIWGFKFSALLKSFIKNAGSYVKSPIWPD